MDGRDALLAVAMNDAALPVEHGFPVRLVVPGLYGYVSACKWIVDIEVTTYASNVSYWAQRGWDAQAPIKTESRIDVPTGLNPVKAGKPITIAGVAWAQHKGIEAVEVRIGKGAWHEARLAAVPGIDTLAAVGLRHRSRHHARQLPRRGARDRQDRLHADVAAGAAGAERRERLPVSPAQRHRLAGARDAHSS